MGWGWAKVESHIFSHLVAGRGFSPGRARDAAPDLSGASGILVVTGSCSGHSSALTPICPFLLRSECRVDVHPSRNCVLPGLREHTEVTTEKKKFGFLLPEIRTDQQRADLSQQ